MLVKALPKVHDDTLDGRPRCTTRLDVANVAQVGLHGRCGAPTGPHKHGIKSAQDDAPSGTGEAGPLRGTVRLQGAHLEGGGPRGDLGFSRVALPWWPTRQQQTPALSQ